jgi:dihydrolipoamide dehydrogenase
MLARNAVQLRRAVRLMSTSTEAYDVVIIGGGPGGYPAAIKAGQLGLRVACIEKRGRLGGTCLNVGCIPSKALLHSSHLYEEAAHGWGPHGISAENVKMDLDKLMQHKNKTVTGLTGGIEGLFKKYKVDYFKGSGEILSAGSVKINVIEGGSEPAMLSTKNIVIATGSEPASLSGVEVDEKTIVTSTGALDLSEVPKSMVVIGAGVIGLEMGSVWRRLGAQVTVVEFLDRITPGMDDEVSNSMEKIFRKQKMKFKLSTKVVSATVNPAGGATLVTEPVAGGEQEKIEADIVLLSTGRLPFTEGLGLENVGIKKSARGQVEVDDHFATNVPGIFAIGDVVRGAMLAHKAEEEGIAIIEQIAGLGGHVNYDAIPNVIYTHPEVASVGKTEEELKKAGVEFKVGKFPFMANSRARANADADGFVKFLADKETDRVLGIHIIASNAGEMIAEGVLAMEYGASAEDIGRTCHAHPTMSEAFKEAAMATYGKPIHF